MTSSESQESPLSASDEQAVTYARESLMTLLRKDSCSPEEISAALENLTELKNRITDVGQRREGLLTENERYSKTCEATRSRQERLDKDIIDAKMKAGELLSQRDSIARDLARAKRALNDMEEPVNMPIPGSTNGVDGYLTPRHDMARTRRRLANCENGGLSSDDDSDNRGDIREQDDLDALQKSVTNDMERLRVAEKELIDVVEEINSVKRKRAELQEKLKAAQEEW